MNRTMKFLKLIILILPVFFFSCNRDRNIVPPTPTYGIIDATVNGYTWSATAGYAQLQNFTLRLYGSGDNGSSLTIDIYPYNGLGTYAANSPAKITFYDGNGLEYNAINGSVNITSDLDFAQGSFYFTGVQNGGSTTVDVSGNFDLDYY
jgi:hypothetical protein